MDYIEALRVLADGQRVSYPSVDGDTIILTSEDDLLFRLSKDSDLKMNLFEVVLEPADLKKIIKYFRDQAERYNDTQDYEEGIIAAVWSEAADILESRRLPPC
jgi:hypothetical protein